MFWYVILMLFSPLYLVFGLVFRSEQARLVLAVLSNNSSEPDYAVEGCLPMRS